MSAKIFARVVIITAVAVVLFPLYWVIITSFKTAGEISSGPSYFPFLDFRPTLKAWGWLFSQTGLRTDLIRSFTSSMIAAGGSSLLAVAVGNLAGYGLTRFRYKFGYMRNDDIAFWFMSQRILPPAAVVISFLYLFRTMGLLDSRLSLAAVYTVFGIPFAVWLMRDAYERIPAELYESAQVDGATEWQMFRRIGLPLALPGTIASFMFAFIFAWNEYLFALMLTFRSAKTMPLLLMNQITSLGIEWNRLSALTLLSMAPAVVFALLLDRYLVQVTFEGGLKG